MNDISPKPYNFICVILGDNDYTSALYDAMYTLKEKTDVKSLCPFVVKEFMIESIIHYHRIKSILHGREYTTEDEQDERKYISKMRVLLNEKFPTLDIEGEIPYDCDGGAIYMDVNTGFISSF